MKGQQLFNSFWLASTTVVLAIQPAWAETVQVTTVRLNPIDSGIEILLETPSSIYPSVLTSSYGETFVANIINAQVLFPKGKIFRTSNPSDGIAHVTVTPLNAKSIRVSAKGLGGAPIGKVLRRGGSLVLKLTASDASLAQDQFQPRKTDQQPTSIKSGQSSQMVQQIQSDPASNNGNSEVAPSTSPTPTSPLSPEPASDIPTTKTPVPSYLNPSPNLLQFPTQPEEVQIQGTQPITLQQAFDLARRNNRTLQVEELNLERSRAQLREALAAEFPTLSVGFGVINGGRDVFSNQVSSVSGNVAGTGTTAGTGLTTGTGTTAGTGLTTGTGTGTGSGGGSSTTATDLSGDLRLSYNLYTSGERRGRIRAAEEQVRFDQLDVERQIEQLRLDVSNDYFDLQTADELVRINSSAVTNAQASLRDAQALEQAGVGTRFAVLQSQVQLANAIQDQTNSLRQQQVSRRQLAQRLSLSSTVSISAADPVEIAGLWNFSLEDSIVLAFQNRAELEQQLALRNQSQQRRRIALSDLGPQVSLVARYGLSDRTNDDENFGDTYSLGANVSLNLFEGGAARARAAAEEANIAIAETNFADTRNQIRFQVEEAYANLQSNLANIQTASVGLEQAREAIRLARLRFQAGVGTQTEVIDAEDDLTEAEGNRVSAIIEYNRSLATLQRNISSGQPR